MRNSIPIYFFKTGMRRGKNDQIRAQKENREGATKTNQTLSDEFYFRLVLTKE